MNFTYGLEFEIQDLSLRSAAAALTRAGIPCRAQDYNHDTDTVWKTVPDGSGVDAEVVSPVLTDERLNECSRVARALQSAGARVNARAGFHVHFGVNGADQIGTGDALANLVVNYYTTHPVFQQVVAPSRIGSRWCRIHSLESAHDIASEIRLGEYNFSSRDHYLRYESLNLQAIGRHGTAEVRLHQGTLNGTKALAWVEFLKSMFRYSAEGKTFTEAYYINATPEQRLNSLPVLFKELRDYGLTERTGDYLLARADELRNRRQQA